MKSVFRYPGGKTKQHAQDWILSHRPAVCNEYREPFVGGGGVFFGLEEGSFANYWLNDIHPGLVAVYQALIDRPKEFIDRCREVEPAQPGDELTEPGEPLAPGGGRRNGSGVCWNKRLKEVFDSVAQDERCDQAFRYFYVNRTVFGGRVNYRLPSRLYFSNPSGWNIVGTRQLERAAGRLRGVRVTQGDYARLFETPAAVAGNQVWIYADPPYLVNTEFVATDQLYEYNFTWDDHVRFAEAVRRCPHKVCVSYDDDAKIRDLFSWCRVVAKEWIYCGSTNGKKEMGKELLLLHNYLPHEIPGAVPAYDGEQGVLWG